MLDMFWGKPTLKLNLVLDDKSFILVINFLGELGRDGMMSSRVFDDETLVSLYALIDSWLFNSPLANIGPIFFTLRVILLSLGGNPS